jgi:hypothetical protein
VTGSTKTIVLHFWEYNWQYENNGTSLLGIWLSVWKQWYFTSGNMIASTKTIVPHFWEYDWLVLYPMIILILILLSAIIPLILRKTILYWYIMYYVLDCSIFNGVNLYLDLWNVNEFNSIQCSMKTTGIPFWDYKRQHENNGTSLLEI